MLDLIESSMKRRNATYDECSEFVACIFGIVKLVPSDRIRVEEAELHVLDVVVLRYKSHLIASILDIEHGAVRVIPSVHEVSRRMARVIILDNSELVVSTSGNLYNDIVCEMRRTACNEKDIHLRPWRTIP